VANIKSSIVEKNSKLQMQEIHKRHKNIDLMAKTFTKLPAVEIRTIFINDILTYFLL
jgi:hypothetical protein